MSRAEGTGVPEDVPHANRRFSALDLFEQYWVQGLSTYQIDAHTHNFEQAGVPLRKPVDAKCLEHGQVELRELWAAYLSEFQIALAQELTAARRWELEQAAVAGDEDE